MALATALGLAGCGDSALLLASACTGPQPELPPLRATLIPTFHNVPATGWPRGGMPRAAHGLQVQAVAAGLYERRGAILHAKTALIDGVWATVGSTNLDRLSFLHNHALNAVVLGAEIGLQVQAMFDENLATSDALVLERWQQRSPILRMQELFTRTWAYRL